MRQDVPANRLERAARNKSHGRTGVGYKIASAAITASSRYQIGDTYIGPGSSLGLQSTMARRLA